MKNFTIIKYPRIRMSQCSKFCSNRPNCKAFYHKKGYWDHGPCIQFSKGFENEDFQVKWTGDEKDHIVYKVPLECRGNETKRPLIDVFDLFQNTIESRFMNDPLKLCKITYTKKCPKCFDFRNLTVEFKNDAQIPPNYYCMADSGMAIFSQL